MPGSSTAPAAPDPWRCCRRRWSRRLGWRPGPGRPVRRRDPPGRACCRPRNHRPAHVLGCLSPERPWLHQRDSTGDRHSGRGTVRLLGWSAVSPELGWDDRRGTRRRAPGRRLDLGLDRGGYRDAVAAARPATNVTTSSATARSAGSSAARRTSHPVPPNWIGCAHSCPRRSTRAPAGSRPGFPMPPGRSLRRTSSWLARVSSRKRRNTAYGSAMKSGDSRR